VPCSGKTDGHTEGPTEFFEKYLGKHQNVMHCLDFSFVFSAPLPALKKPVFRKRDLLRWNVPATLSLFLKSEKIPALL
jgi:hypothetical protein